MPTVGFGAHKCLLKQHCKSTTFQQMVLKMQQMTNDLYKSRTWEKGGLQGERSLRFLWASFGRRRWGPRGRCRRGKCSGPGGCGWNPEAAGDCGGGWSGARPPGVGEGHRDVAGGTGQGCKWRAGGVEGAPPAMVTRPAGSEGQTGTPTPAPQSPLV